MFIAFSCSYKNAINLHLEPRPIHIGKGKEIGPWE